MSRENLRDVLAKSCKVIEFRMKNCPELSTRTEWIFRTQLGELILLELQYYDSKNKLDDTVPQCFACKLKLCKCYL